jgi:glucose/arabinose dehydrogenase
MLPSNLWSLTSGRSRAPRFGATMLALAFAAVSATTACSPAEPTGMGTGGSGSGTGGSSAGGRGGSGTGGSSSTGGRGGATGGSTGTGGSGTGGSTGTGGSGTGGSGTGGSGTGGSGTGGSGTGGSAGTGGSGTGGSAGTGGSGTGGSGTDMGGMEAPPSGTGGTGGGNNAPCTGEPAAEAPALKRGAPINGFAGQAGQVVGVPGENTLYVIGHRNGNVYTVMNGMVQAQPLLHVNNSAGPGNEQGLLSMALHPKFAQNKLFYIFYTPAGMAQSRVEEWERMSPTTAMFKQATYTGRGSGRYHNGGSIYFSPKDTEPLLYHSVGNAESADAGNPMGTVGRILRYNVETKMGVPAKTGGVGMFTFAYGLRNPYRMSIDRLTGDIYVGDVANGPGGGIAAAPYGTEGKDFGYRANNGTPDVNKSLAAEGGGAAIIGGVVYRGNKIPGLCGRYFYGVHAGGVVKSMIVKNGQRMGAITTHGTLTVPGNISSFGEDGEGEVWMSSMNGNAIYKIEAGP